MAPSWADIAPDWLVNNSETLKALLQNPSRWLRKNIAEYLVGGIIGFAVFVADVLQKPFNIVATAISTAGLKLFSPAAIFVEAIAGIWSHVEAAIFAIATQFGPLAPLVTAVLIGLIALILLRLLLAALVVLEEVIGSVPVLGGAVSGASRALRALFGGLA